MKGIEWLDESRMEEECTMKKKGILQLASQLKNWVTLDTCNSLYLYTVNANEQVAWVAKVQLIIYIMQLIVI